MALLKLNSIEYQILSNMAQRELKRMEAKTEPKNRIKPEYLVAKAAAEAFSAAPPEDPQGTINITIKRRTLRLLEHMLQTKIAIIDSAMIPGYMNRIDRGENVEANEAHLKRIIGTRDQVLHTALKKVQEFL